MNDPLNYQIQEEKYKDLYPKIQKAFGLSFPLTFKTAVQYSDALFCEKFQGLTERYNFTEQDWTRIKMMLVESL